MNKNLHRIVFNKHRGEFVVVSETVVSERKSGGGQSDCGGAGSVLARLVALGVFGAFGALGLLGEMQTAWAAPTGGKVVAGSAGISQAGTLTNIQQNSARAIINWQSFGINKGEAVKIDAPSLNSATLNRVTGKLGSRIDGSLLSNGKVFLINPKGVVIGRDGIVNVNGGFVASTQDVSDSAFMNGGALNFNGEATGNIQILGLVKSSGGDIVIIAPKTDVAAGAQLQAAGKLQLIAASDVTLSNGQFSVAPKAGDKGQITTAGALEAAQVQLAAVNNNLGALAINASGTIRATGTQTNPDGSISLVASGTGGNLTVSNAHLAANKADGSGGKIEIKADATSGIALIIDSTLSASSTNRSGGKIDVTGRNTGLTGATTLDASGASQGGAIRVGGGFQGKDTDLPNAQATYVGKDVTIKADGTQGNADAGKLTVWADEITRFGGNLQATGSGSGKGGEAEVSGKGTLVFEPGSVKLSGGATGTTGSLLLDPTDVIIDNAAVDSGFSGTSTPDFSASGGTSTISGNTLRTAIAAANVTIDSSGGVGGNGDITFQGTPLNLLNGSAGWTPNILMLKAYRDINVNTSLSIDLELQLDARAARDINWNAAGSFYSASFGAIRNINVSAPITANSLYLVAGTQGTASNLLTATSSSYLNAWQSGTPSGAVKMLAGGPILNADLAFRLQSGIDPLSGVRSDFSLSSMGTLPGTWLIMHGLNKLTYDKDIPVGKAANHTAYARDVDFNTALIGSDTTSINAAAYNASNSGASAGSGWQNQYGTITFTNPNIQFNDGNLLSLASGLGAGNSVSNNTRSDLPGTVNLNGTYTSGLTLSGFRDVTLSTPTKGSITGANITVNALNINAQSDLFATTTLRLNAGTYDPGATVPNSYSTSSWRSQQGMLNIAPNHTLRAQNFYFYSGIDPANPTVAGARADLPDSVTLLPAAGQTTANRLELSGLRDLTYPAALATLTDAVVIQARNISVPASVSAITAPTAIDLRAASFWNTGANINKTNQLQGRNGEGDGWLWFQAPAMSLEARTVYLASSTKTASDLSRADANFTQFQATPLSRAGTYEWAALYGFNTLSLPEVKHGDAFNNVATSNFKVYSENIILNGDINSGLIWLNAGYYNPTTVGSRLTFNNNPVLRATNASLGERGAISLDAGANNVKPLTGVRFGYMPGKSALDALALQNFNGTEVSTENGADLLLQTPYNLSSFQLLTITQVPGATGDVVLNSNIKIDAPNINLPSISQIAYIDLATGGLRMGDKVLSAPGKPVRLIKANSNRNAALNLDASALNLSDNGGAGTGTMVVNAANNLSLNEAGGSSLEVNTRGELTLTAIGARTNNSSLTLRGDSTYGRTIAQSDATGALVDENLNTVFAAYNRGVYGEQGGDGLGAVTLATAGPILVVPIFRQTMVTETAFTVAAANTVYALNGSAYAAGAAIPKGTVVSVVSGFDRASNMGKLDVVTSNGVPLRTVYQTGIGGYTVGATEANIYYTAAGTPIATGTFLPTDTVVFIKPYYSLAGKNLGYGSAAAAAAASWSPGAELYVIGGYTAPTAGLSANNYTSTGTGFTASNTWNTNIGANSASSASTTLGVDTAVVDTSLAASYYGNPVTGTSNALNMSGQFYTVTNIYGPNAYQAAPTKLNGLAGGSGNNSASGNSWDVGYSTATLQTNTGDLRIYSGPMHAVAAAGYAAGDAADLNLFANPAASTFGYASTVRDGGTRLITNGGDLVALGYRDVNIEPSAVVTSTGNVTIGAARDLNINSSVTLGGANKLVTLAAGNMISTAAGMSINGNGSTAASGAGDLMLIAGHGVNVNTNVARIAGGLQDNPATVGVLAGGVAPTGRFKVTNVTGLTVGGTLVNGEVPNISFDGTAGILYPDPTVPLTRSGITTAGGAAPAFGNVDIVTTTGDLSVTGAGVDTTATGGEISLKAAATTADILLGGNVTTTGNAFVQAGRNIVQTDAAKRIAANIATLSAGTGMGTAASRVQTSVNQLAINGSTTATGVSYVQEADALTLAGVSANNGSIDVQTSSGTLTVGTVSATPTGAAAGLTAIGITANGSGSVSLTANGAGSDVELGATVRSGTGTLSVTANRNILDTLAGDLGSATDASSSTALNLATGGSVVMSAGDSVGGNGVSAIDALEVWYDGTLASTSNGAGTASGTYLTLLDAPATPGVLTLPRPSLSITSAKNVDVTSRASTTVGSGQLTVDNGGITTANNGYIRLAADDNVTLNKAVTANGSGNVVLTAGLGGTGNLTQNAGGTITSGSGEINLKATGNIVQGDTASTTGALIALADGAITHTGGTWSADSIALTGATLGTAANRLLTDAAQTVLQSAGDQYLTSSNAATLAASTTNDGAIDVQTASGTLTIGSVSVASGLTSTTGGVTAWAPGLTATGVTANGTGNVSLKANGAGSDVVLNADVTSGAGNIGLAATQDIRFAANLARAATASAVNLNAGRDILNTTGAASGVAGRDQIVAATAILRAGGKVGSGAIDNTLTGVNNDADLNLDVAALTANANGGDAVLWNRGAVVLAGANSAVGSFGLNAGGAITQGVGGTLTAAAAEFDTMRDVSIGVVALQNTGDLTIGGTNVVGGNYSASSQSGQINQNGTLNVHGDVTLTGTAIHLNGPVNQSGNLVQNGVITNAAGAAIAGLVISGSNATVTAYGNGANFDLASALTPAVLAGLPTGVTTVTVNLGNTVTSYSVAALTTNAILMENTGNAVSGNWTVRTGSGALATPTQNARDYHLTDTTGPVKLGSKDVVVNAARGTAYAAGTQPSPLAAQVSAANTAAGFDPVKGSNVTLTQTQTDGRWSVRDAYDVTIDSPGNVTVADLTANNNAAVVAGAASNKSLTLDGQVRTNGSFIGVAGKDVTLTAAADIVASQRLTFVADETAGTAAGAGWFRNNGAAQVASGISDIAIYAVAGGTLPAGYVTATGSQIVLGGIGGLSETQPLSHWNTPYQTQTGGSINWAGFAADGSKYVAGAGAFGSSALWYKAAAVAVPYPPPVTPESPVTLVGPGYSITPPVVLPITLPTQSPDPIIAALLSDAPLDDLLAATAAGDCKTENYRAGGQWLFDEDSNLTLYIFGVINYLPPDPRVKKLKPWEHHCNPEREFDQEEQPLAAGK